MSESIPDGVVSGVRRWIVAAALVVMLVAVTAVVYAPGCRGSTPPVLAGQPAQHRSETGATRTGATCPTAGEPITVEVDGKRVTAPAGSRVSVVTEEVGEDRETTTKSEARGDDPTASATDRAAKSGGGATDYAGIAGLIDAAKAGDPKYLSIVVIGALLVAGGLLVLLWLGRKALGLGLIAGGAAMVTLGVVADASPWVFAAVVLVALVGVVLVIAHARLARGESAALSAIVPAVEKADPSSTNGIKSAIEANAGPAVSAVRAAVRRVKAKVLKNTT